MKEKLQGNSCNFLDYPTTQIFASLINFATIKMIGERKIFFGCIFHPIYIQQGLKNYQRGNIDEV